LQAAANEQLLVGDPWSLLGGRPRIADEQSDDQGWSATNGLLPAVPKYSKLVPTKKFLFPPTYIFLRMWSTLASWLQRMLAQPWYTDAH
jgi:hypothetical protein